MWTIPIVWPWYFYQSTDSFILYKPCWLFNCKKKKKKQQKKQKTDTQQRNKWDRKGTCFDNSIQIQISTILSVRMPFPTSFTRSLSLRCLSPFSSLLFSSHVKFPPLYHRLIHFPPYFHIICMRCQCALWTGSFDYCITYTLITCTLDLWKSIVC